MGIDLGVGDGTTVVSAASGNTIFIDHGSGYMTQYSHLQEFSVSVGQTVNIGQRIALSGHSGVGTGAHLHFGALAGTSGGNIHTGYYIDPHTFLGK
jgi:murein DD-endopeptidase MepM/ murein hydrolase activator NlpD